MVLYTEKFFFELGLLAHDSVIKCLAPDEEGFYDSIQTITPAILAKFNTLTNLDFGTTHFTDFDYIKKFQSTMRDLGKRNKVLIQAHWTGIKPLMDVVKHINNGMDLFEAHKKVVKENESKND